MKINTQKISRNLKVEISLSVLKLMHLGKFASDLSKLGLKIKVRVFSIDAKRKFDNLTKAFCSMVNKTFLVCFVLGGGHPVYDKIFAPRFVISQGTNYGT